MSVKLGTINSCEKYEIAKIACKNKNKNCNKKIKTISKINEEQKITKKCLGANVGHN